VVSAAIILNAALLKSAAFLFSYHQEEPFVEFIEIGLGKL
jgi:hypothetical protein